MYPSNSIFDRIRAMQAAAQNAPQVNIRAQVPFENRIKRGWFGQLPAEVVTPRPMPIVGLTNKGGGGIRKDGYYHRDAQMGRDSALGDWTDILAGSAEGGEDTGPSNMGPMPTAGGGGILSSLFAGFGDILNKTATSYATMKSKEILAGQTVKTANAQYQARLAMPPTSILGGMTTGTMLTLAAAGVGLYLVMRKK
jgi:hypothetical protein